MEPHADTLAAPSPARRFGRGGTRELLCDGPVTSGL